MLRSLTHSGGVKLCVAAALVLALMTGCSAASETPALTPTPGLTAMPSAAPQAQAEVLVVVGEQAKMTVGGNAIDSKAYYVGGNRDKMVLPIAEVAKALGWTVNEAADGQMEMTRSGMPNVTVHFTKPAANVAGSIRDVKVSKGEENVDVAGDIFTYIDGALYATEGFFNSALQGIDVKYDGKTQITIEAKA